MNGMQENALMDSLIRIRLGLMMIWGILTNSDGEISQKRVMKEDCLVFLLFAMISQNPNSKVLLIPTYSFNLFRTMLTKRLQSSYFSPKTTLA